MPRVKVWVWWLSVSFVFALLLMRKAQAHIRIE